MTPEENEFLLAEFNTSWEMVFKIEEKRGAFTKLFSFLLIAVLSVVSGILAKEDSLSLFVCIVCTFLFFITSYVGSILKNILQTERKANVRYREKINLIREMLLASSNDDVIKEYIKKDELGIILYSNRKHQPHKDGGVLTKIYKFIEFNQGVFIVLTIVLWSYYLFYELKIHQ